MRKFNPANAYETLRPALHQLVNGFNLVCKYPGCNV